MMISETLREITKEKSILQPIWQKNFKKNANMLNGIKKAPRGALFYRIFG